MSQKQALLGAGKTLFAGGFDVLPQRRGKPASASRGFRAVKPNKKTAADSPLDGDACSYRVK